MALRTPQEYRASLQDERVIYYKGERVKDVTTHPVLGVAVQHASIDYAMAENPRYRDLAMVHDPQTGEGLQGRCQLDRCQPGKRGVGRWRLYLCDGNGRPREDDETDHTRRQRHHAVL